MKIQYLKSLQHLAKKSGAKIIITYYPISEDWFGEFGFGFQRPEIIVSDTNFTTMLQKLYKEVKKI